MLVVVDQAMVTQRVTLRVVQRLQVSSLGSGTAMLVRHLQLLHEARGWGPGCCGLQTAHSTIPGSSWHMADTCMNALQQPCGN
jgi:hypothetical protein